MTTAWGDFFLPSLRIPSRAACCQNSLFKGALPPPARYAGNSKLNPVHMLQPPPSALRSPRAPPLPNHPRAAAPPEPVGLGQPVTASR